MSGPSSLQQQSANAEGVTGKQPVDVGTVTNEAQMAWMTVGSG